MARPREFDVDHALEQAMEVFWARGFEAASVSDLKGAMGIETGSLYKAFGSKRELYLSALARYLDRGTRMQLRMIGSEGPAVDGIARLFHAVVGVASDPSRRGCFGVNCAIEMGGTDTDAQALLKRQDAQVMEHLTRRISADQGAGLIQSKTPADDLARYVFAMLGGIQVSAKKGASHDALTAIADAALNAFNP